MRHVLEAQQFSRKTLTALFASADSMQDPAGPLLKGKILASLFYEPSTRTRFSFESAMIRLGGNVLTTENAKEFSSAVKGETLEDSIRVIGAYADAIALRHYEIGAASRAAAVSSIPIINAGDGAGQHPTQALLDLYTVQRELGRIDGITVAMIGDLKNGRTIRSLSYLLGRYEEVRVYLIAPPELQIGNDIQEYLDRNKVHYELLERFEPVINEVDVVYQTRIQKERFADKDEYKKYKGVFILDKQNTAGMKDGSIIMHPLPRVDELNADIDALPKAAYFKQAGYGLLVRMALLADVLS